MKINRHIFAVYALCAAGANSCAPGAPPVQKQSSQTKNNEKPKNQADSEILNESGPSQIADTNHPMRAQRPTGAYAPIGAIDSNGGNAVTQLLCAPKSIKIDQLCIPAKPVHHWFSVSLSDHLYTMSANPDCVGKYKTHPSCGGEAVNEDQYSYLGIAYYSLDNIEPTDPQLVKFFRLYDTSLRQHFYTTNTEIRDNYVNNAKYLLQGWFLSLPLSPPATKALHLWFSAKTNGNFYSFSAGADCAGKTAVHPSCGGDGANKQGEQVNELGYSYRGIAGNFFVP